LNDKRRGKKKVGERTQQPTESEKRKGSTFPNHEELKRKCLVLSNRKAAKTRKEKGYLKTRERNSGK